MTEIMDGINFKETWFLQKNKAETEENERLEKYAKLVFNSMGDYIEATLSTEVPGLTPEVKYSASNYAEMLSQYEPAPTEKGPYADKVFKYFVYQSPYKQLLADKHWDVKYLMVPDNFPMLVLTPSSNPSPASKEAR